MSNISVSNDRLVRTIRLDDEKILQILDELDASSPEPPGVRKQQRFTYRIKALVVHIQQSPQMDPTPYLVPSRNISAGGLSFLHGGFIHTGTRCLVQLITTYGTWTNVVGKVTRCRYLKSNIHEVSIKFDQEVDPSVYCSEAITNKVLLVEDDPAACRLVRFHLEQLNALVEHAENGEIAIEKALNNKYDLILMDIDMPVMNGHDATAALRDQGYTGMIVAATALTQPEDQQRCFESGCNKFLPKPYNRNDLAALLDSIREEPLFSSMHDDPSMAELIHTFVLELPTTTSEIGCAIADQDAKKLESVVRQLKGRAASFGFDEITDAAKIIENKLIQQPSIEEVQDEARKLAKLCLQARSPVDIPGLKR